ncbi:MAG: ATP-binding protein, partial [Stackebrandtia sp.]
LGMHVELIGRLRAMVAAEPLHEHVVGMLMLALYRAGRRDEALTLFRDTRRRLSGDLGVEPGGALKHLHRKILSSDAELNVPTPPSQRTPPSSAGAVRGTKPAQLPADLPGFTGRKPQLSQLDAILDKGVEDSTPPPVAVLSGPAGAGKTTLALHWSHRVAAQFPDGQLYVNLRGFDPAGTAVDPSHALRESLHALGVPAQRVPAELEARQGMYRSLLSGKRVLIVLDNARDSAQVRPLLPGSSRCMAVVTSRDVLSGLVAAEAAIPIRLDVMSLAESKDLLAARLGHTRVDSSEPTLLTVVESCARLPLALAITAARLATQPDLSMDDLAAELVSAGADLDSFDSGDSELSLRSAFTCSYGALRPEAARMFRLLGLHPGVDISVPAAASLAAVSRPRARALLAELTRTSLQSERRSGRYGCHDLLRAYAGELAHRDDSADELRAASHRSLDYYLRTAHAAALAVDPNRRPIELPEPLDDPAPDELSCAQEAMEWFAAEHSTLVDMAVHALAEGFYAHAWQLIWSMETYFSRSGYWDEWVGAQRVALDAAQRLGDRLRAAHLRRNLGRAYTQLGDADAALESFQQALQEFADIRDSEGRADAHRGIAWLFTRQNRLPEALTHSRRALSLYREAGNRRREALALNAVGWRLTLLDEHREAISYCRQALTLFHEFADAGGPSGFGEAETWDSLGHAHHKLGEIDEAVACFRRSLDILAPTGDRQFSAEVFDRLGQAHESAGDKTAAVAAWRRALKLLDELEHPDAESVRARIDQFAV